MYRIINLLGVNDSGLSNLLLLKLKFISYGR
jgi:hypothetical protein